MEKLNNLELSFDSFFLEKKPILWMGFLQMIFARSQSQF